MTRAHKQKLSPPRRNLRALIMAELETCTVRALAEDLGLSPGYVHRLAKGKRWSLQKPRWPRVARRLRVDLSEMPQLVPPLRRCRTR